MSKLEKYIHENREQFYSHELPEGHEARFLQKLQHQNRPSLRMQLLRFAAIALVATGLVGGVHYYEQQQMEMTLLAAFPEELQEAENYYTMRCNEELSILQTRNVGNSVVDITQELEKLETTYARLKKMLLQEPQNQRIMIALVENLQLRLQLLQQLNSLIENEESQTFEV